MDGVGPEEESRGSLSRAFGLVIAGRRSVHFDGVDEPDGSLFLNAALLDVLQVFEHAGVVPEGVSREPLSMEAALQAALDELEACPGDEATRIRGMLRSLAEAGC